jgi:hypothetical protein
MIYEGKKNLRILLYLQFLLEHVVKNLMTCIFLKTYQIRGFFHKNHVYVTKLNFVWRNEKNCPKKMKGMYLCERLNLYQLTCKPQFLQMSITLRCKMKITFSLPIEKNTIKIHCWFDSKVF